MSRELTKPSKGKIRQDVKDARHQSCSLQSSVLRGLREGPSRKGQGMLFCSFFLPSFQMWFFRRGVTTWKLRTERLGRVWNNVCPGTKGDRSTEVSTSLVVGITCRGSKRKWCRQNKRLGNSLTVCLLRSPLPPYCCWSCQSVSPT